jgi:hypothetical protein
VSELIRCVTERGTGVKDYAPNYMVDTTSQKSSIISILARLCVDLSYRARNSWMDDAQPGPDADTIEVTPEMMEAGLRTLYESGAIENPIEGADRRLVSEIFSVMTGAMRALRLKVHEGPLLS